MKIFLALAYACGALAVAVQPLQPADTHHDVTSLESNLHNGPNPIATAPQVGGAESRDEELAEIEPLENRMDGPGRIRILIPTPTRQETVSYAAMGIAFAFRMIKKNVYRGGERTRVLYCKYITYTNGRDAKRKLTAFINGLLYFTTTLVRGQAFKKNVPPGVVEYDLTVEIVPDEDSPPRRPLEKKMDSGTQHIILPAARRKGTITDIVMGLTLAYRITKKQSRIGAQKIGVWACKYITFTNGPDVRRKLTATLSNGVQWFTRTLLRNESYKQNVPPGMDDYILTVKNVPNDDPPPRLLEKRTDPGTQLMHLPHPVRDQIITGFALGLTLAYRFIKESMLVMGNRVEVLTCNSITFANGRDARRRITATFSTGVAWFAKTLNRGQSIRQNVPPFTNEYTLTVEMVPDDDHPPPR